MRIVVDMNHPADVHYYRVFIREMEKRGHEFLITASEKEVSFRLLDIYGFNYVKLGNYGKSIAEKLVKIPILDFRLYLIARKFNPDIILGFSSARAAHVSKLLGKPCVISDDTEHAKWEHLLFASFSDTIITPSCFAKVFKDHQIRYNGYKELAYLHPNRFSPLSDTLTEQGLTKEETYIIIRFVSWNAGHDMGQHGIKNGIGLVKRLESFGRVLITSEGPLPTELEQYRIHVSPEKLHDLLYYATLYIGEGATTASECAVLGTHAIYVNTLGAGTISEQEKKYGLVYTFSDPSDMSDSVIRTASALLEDPNLRCKGKIKRERILKEKIDVTAFMIWFVENYPQSISLMRENPDIQSQFVSYPDVILDRTLI